VGTKKGQPYYELEMTEFSQNLHSDMGDTRLWGYAGSYPGPIIEAHEDNPIYVRWINKLPNEHFLPIDMTIHGVMDNPEVRAVVHLHGLNVKPESDGFLNGSNARDYALRFSGEPGQILPSMNQIGTDGGFLEQPAKLSTLSFLPAERADVIIDFTGLENQIFNLVNDSTPPFGTPLPEIMQFRVSGEPVEDDSSLPRKLNNIDPLPIKKAKKH